LSDATAVFKHSRTARSLFGDAFVDHFAASRQWEASEHRKHVSDWELQRYFEII
jgi:glutamine synthetase